MSRLARRALGAFVLAWLAGFACALAARAALAATTPREACPAGAQVDRVEAGFAVLVLGASGVRAVGASSAREPPFAASWSVPLGLFAAPRAPREGDRVAPAPGRSSAPCLATPPPPSARAAQRRLLRGLSTP